MLVHYFQKQNFQKLTPRDKLVKLVMVMEITLTILISLDIFISYPCEMHVFISANPGPNLIWQYV